jgi:hypothetical protein
LIRLSGGLSERSGRWAFDLRDQFAIAGFTRARWRVLRQPASPAWKQIRFCFTNEGHGGTPREGGCEETYNTEPDHGAQYAGAASGYLVYKVLLYP